MMSNESAFPHPKTNGPYGEDLKVYEGLTKREYMATHILAGLMACAFKPDNISYKEAAIAAVTMADALIEEIKK